MTTKSRRNQPFDDEPEYTFGKFEPTTEAPKGVPEDGQWWRTSSLDDATPDEWDRAAQAAYGEPQVGKLFHPSDAVPAGFKPDEYTISEGGVKTWTKESCPVENPDHYNTGAIEAIEAIRASMPTEQFFGYLKGNVMKYLWRYDYKEKPVEDLRKADWYLNRLIDALIEDNQ
jgi:hypothetical protein